MKRLDHSTNSNYLSYYRYVKVLTIYFGSASDLHLSPELCRLPVIMEYEI